MCVCGLGFVKSPLEAEWFVLAFHPFLFSVFAVGLSGISLLYSAQVTYYAVRLLYAF